MSIKYVYTHTPMAHKVLQNGHFFLSLTHTAETFKFHHTPLDLDSPRTLGALIIRIGFWGI